RCKFPTKSIPGFSSLPLQERLMKTDDANEVFRFAYTARKDSEEHKYYKIPLIRDTNVDIADICIEISKEEYQRATKILKNSGELQRIVRAIPYSNLHAQVHAHLAECGVTLDDAVVVGIDRGGRIPAIIMKEALGLSVVRFLKVDQGSRRIDEDGLEKFIRLGTFNGKHVMFVDSTVDSGRQIRALENYFDDRGYAQRIGHTGWSVVGSNEDGETLNHHLNINWGLNPDESFEDDPLLLGVDYTPNSHTRIQGAPSKCAREIRSALREVPRGIILDFDTVAEEAAAPQKEIKKVLASKGWANAKARWETFGTENPELLLSPRPYQEKPERQSLAVIGSGKAADLTDAEIKFLESALSSSFAFYAGTPNGNPGKLLQYVHERCGDATFIQPQYMEGVVSLEYYTEFAGETKMEFREHIIERADVVLALSGSDGTLTEALLTLLSGKDLVVVKNYGALGNYFASSRKYKKFDNLHLVDSLEAAADKLLELYER
ncbi:phosphoribosyltransferase, partial [Candidatus Micrarchaeota archaeon]|nr:phosphoribosyltransferase [Candidatus Micrarchaeota archaeon]